MVTRTRIRKGHIESYVPPHRWRHGKSGRHPGYWRFKRPKGKKRIVGKKIPNLYPVRDEYGQWRGFTSKPP